MNPTQFRRHHKIREGYQALLVVCFLIAYLMFSVVTSQEQPPTAPLEVFTPTPPKTVNQFEICEKAINAGFLHYGKYLLNPKDFQTLGLQSIVQPYLTRLNQALETQDIELISLVLPPRGVLFPELSTSSQSEYIQLLESLQETGLQVISISDVLENYGADFFFEYDHHWTPFGAREVAKEIATTISIEPELQQDFISSQIRYSWSPYNSRLQSLSKLCGVDYAARANPSGEAGFLTSWSTSMSATEGLFDTRAAEYIQPSVLLGTSNSESSTLNFAGFLSEQTGLSISNYSFSSSGALGSMMHYFLSTEFQQSKPNYIFWEFLANPHTTDYNLNSIRYYRQIIPSLSGSCEGSSLTNATIELENDVPRQYLSLFPNESIVQDINGSNYYLSFNLTGDYMDRVVVDIEYSSGTIDQNSLHMLAPIAGEQRAYLEFLNTMAGQPRSIHLTFPKASSAEAKTIVDVDLCLTAEQD